MIQEQTTGLQSFRAKNVMARFALQNHYGQTLDRETTDLETADSKPGDPRRETGPKPPNSRKARDTIYCPCCKRNHHVCIDSDQGCHSVLKSWMFDLYICKDCNKSFSLAGLPIVLPASVLIGAAVLLIGQLIRSQF